MTPKQTNESSLCCGAERSEFDPNRCSKCHEGASFETLCAACEDRCLLDGKPLDAVVWDDGDFVYHKTCVPREAMA